MKHTALVRHAPFCSGGVKERDSINAELLFRTQTKRKVRAHEWKDEKEKHIYVYIQCKTYDKGKRRSEESATFAGKNKQTKLKGVSFVQVIHS